MRLLRRTYTNLRRRSSIATFPVYSSSYGFKKPHPSSSSRKDAVSAVVKQFRALTLDQRTRAVNRVMQQTNRKQLDDKFIEHFFLEADKDKDGLLNKHEFRAFLASRFSLKVFQASDTNQSVARPTNEQLKLVMIASAIPFVGFGFVDNIIMLAAGDMIEDHFHATYHISMLCAAALGNTVSDVVGLSLGGIIETFAWKIGIPDPQLSKPTCRSRTGATFWRRQAASHSRRMRGRRQEEHKAKRSWRHDEADKVVIGNCNSIGNVSAGPKHSDDDYLSPRAAAIA